jgi:hypothetical protein
VSPWLGLFEAPRADSKRRPLRRRRSKGAAQAGMPGGPSDADADKVTTIHSARAGSVGIRRIAKELGVGVGSVLRITGTALQPA